MGRPNLVRRYIRKDIVTLIEEHDWRTEEEVALGRTLNLGEVIDRALQLADRERRKATTPLRSRSW